MKRARKSTTSHAAPPGFGDDDIKDVCWPDIEMLPGELPALFRLRCVLILAGCRVRKIEPETTHPVVAVWAVLTSVPRQANHRQLQQFFHRILMQGGFRPKSDEWSVSQAGNRTTLAFLWRESPIDCQTVLRQAQQRAAQFGDLVPESPTKH